MEPQLLNPPLYNRPQKVPKHEFDKAPDETILQQVNEAYEAASRNQSGHMTLVRDLWRLWRFYKSAGSYIKVFNPIGYALTVGILSKMFVRTPSFVMQERSGGWKWLAKILQAYLELQFDNPDSEEPISEEFISFLTELTVTGTAVYKVHWCTKYHTTWTSEWDMLKGRYERKATRDTAYDDPKFEHWPLENFYIQPGARNVDEAKYVIAEQWLDEAQLAALGEIVDEVTGKPVYEFIPDALAGKSSGAEPYDKDGVKEARKSRHETTSEERKDKFHLLEYWEDDRLVVVIDKKWVSRNEDNPFDHGRKPFGSMQYVNVPHEFYGIGALEPVVDLQKAINITLTQRLEYVSNLLKQQFAVVGGAKVDEDALLEGYPIVHMSTPDAVTPLDKGNVPQASFVTAEELTGAMERTMGISGYQVGVPSSSQDKTQGTLGGIEAIVAEAQTRFELTMRRFEEVVLKKVAKLFLDLDRQYFSTTQEKMVLVTDNQEQFPVPVTQELLRLGDWFISVVPGSTGKADKEKKAQGFARWAAFAMGTLPQAIDRNLIVLQAAEYEEIDNPERFIIQQPLAPALPPGGAPPATAEEPAFGPQ